MKFLVIALCSVFSVANAAIETDVTCAFPSQGTFIVKQLKNPGSNKGFTSFPVVSIGKDGKSLNGTISEFSVGGASVSSDRKRNGLNFRFTVGNQTKDLSIYSCEPTGTDSFAASIGDNPSPQKNKSDFSLLKNVESGTCVGKDLNQAVGYGCPQTK